MSTQSLTIIALVAILLAVVIASFINSMALSRAARRKGAVIPKRMPPRPAPIPLDLREKLTHHEPPSEDRFLGGLGAGRGGLCVGMTTPSCINFLSFPISDGFENIFYINVGGANGSRLKTTNVAMKECVDRRLHRRNRIPNPIEFRFGGLRGDRTVIEMDVQTFKGGYIIRIKRDNLGNGGNIRFPGNDGRNTTRYKGKQCRYHDRKQCDKTAELV